MLPLFAAEGVTRTTFEWGRIQSNADWILPVGACLAIMMFVRWMYRRDAVELGPVLGWLLTALRTVAFLGLLILYLQPQWRTQREVVRNSRVVLLVDMSLSMGLSDEVGGTSSRARQIAATLEKTDLLPQLRKTHDVVVMRFDEDIKQVISLDKLDPKPATDAESAKPKQLPAKKTPGKKIAAEKIDWHDSLAPSGTETRLGQALGQLGRDQRSAPISGIVVFTDGGQNAGIAPRAATAAAREAKMPIFTVGIGSDRRPVNVRVSDLIAPARAYPGDQYTVTGFIQAQGLAGRVITVELLARDADSGPAASQSGTGTLVESQEITLGADGEVLPVKFELTPDETGRRTLCLRVQAPRADRNPNDNHREADVEIVDRKNRVLLFAGGPMREYRFLRTQLHRDKSVTVDVLLQTGQPGISQEANEILDDFPITREEMYEYDCVVAFDPDWQALSTAQIDLLESWVAEQGGGLIVIAGPIFTGKPINGWVQDEQMAKIRALYPVEFHHRFSMFEGASYVVREPWPLDFTREGMDAEFLWLADTATSSQQAWAGFAGVYSHFPVPGPQPAATVLARFSDPRTGQDDTLPIFLAGQFYGSGRVFYLGSGEMWRLRQVADTYFEKFYTKLIRHVSQGRLLRGSSRGVLLVARDRYLLGSTVEVRARLTNARLEPLDAPSVALEVVRPAGKVETVTLRPDPTRAGTFAGRFTALAEGAYRLELPVPESDDERLTRRIQVKMPDLERENPQRNDALLSEIARNTHGKYYVGVKAALAGKPPLVTQLKDRTRTRILPAAPNPLWEETWMRWMMYTLCSLLCLEWLIRRLVKLA